MSLSRAEACFAERLASTVEAEGIGRSCRVAGMKKLLDGQDFSGQTPPCNVVVLCNAFSIRQISTATRGSRVTPMPSAISCSSLSNRFCPRRRPVPPCFTTLDRHARRSHNRRWTRGGCTGHPEQHHSALPGLVQAPLWGLGKVVALEEPRLGTTLVDLPASMSSISLEIEALIAELRENDGEEQIALRVVADKSESNGSVGHVERLVSRLSLQSLSVTDRAQQDLPALQLCGDGAYLVTGGLALGARLCQIFGGRGCALLSAEFPTWRLHG